MQNSKIVFGLLVVMLIMSGWKANAQLNGILGLKSGAGFIAGDSIIFAEDFGAGKPGSNATSFKSNAAATITTLDGQKGKWLSLQDKATYKLAGPIIYPSRFTVEFDMLAIGDNIKDIAPTSFGFATDNSVREYTSNTGTYVECHYYDANMVNIGNSLDNKYVNTSFDLTTSLNRPMHVSISIDGKKMAVYLDKTKLCDAEFVTPSAAKNFYITAPWEYANGARLYISHLKIAK